jgi:hypothetical protein
MNLTSELSVEELFLIEQSMLLYQRSSPREKELYYRQLLHQAFMMQKVARQLFEELEEREQAESQLSVNALIGFSDG